MLIRTIILSLLVAAILNMIAAIAHRLVSRKVDNIRQLQWVRNYYLGGWRSNPTMVSSAFIWLKPMFLILATTAFDGALTWLPVITMYTLKCDWMIAFVYIALVMRHINGEDVHFRYMAECKSALNVTTLIVCTFDIGGDYLMILVRELDLSFAPIINTVALVVVTRLTLWIVLGGPGRLWSKIKNKLKSLKPKPALRLQPQAN
jgi:hypothetical protein